MLQQVRQRMARDTRHALEMDVDRAIKHHIRRLKDVAIVKDHALVRKVRVENVYATLSVDGTRQISPP